MRPILLEVIGIVWNCLELGHKNIMPSDKIGAIYVDCTLSNIINIISPTSDPVCCNKWRKK